MVLSEPPRSFGFRPELQDRRAAIDKTAKLINKQPFPQTNSRPASTDNQRPLMQTEDRTKFLLRLNRSYCSERFAIAESRDGCLRVQRITGKGRS